MTDNLDWLNKEFSDLSRKLDARTKAEKEANEAGILAIKKYTEEGTTKIASCFLAGVMLGFYNAKNNGLSMSQLHINWALERFFGDTIEPYLHRYVEIYNKLSRLKIFSRDKALSFGDLDYSIWAEKSTDKKVIVMECHASDNTFIFIYEENEISRKLHIRKCWPKVKKVTNGGTGWEYVERSSLSLWRKMNFNPQYRDFRDCDYCGSYEQFFYSATLGKMPPKVDGAFVYCNEIYWAINSLTFLIDCIENVEELAEFDIGGEG